MQFPLIFKGPATLFYWLLATASLPYGSAWPYLVRRYVWVLPAVRVLPCGHSLA